MFRFGEPLKFWKHQLSFKENEQVTFGKALYTEDEAALIMKGIMNGLHNIHEKNYIHRDLKPANIMFRGDDQLAIADFGISKRVDQTTQLTQVGMVMGTPYYMSPEQLRAEPLDQRADLYSLGIIMFELLTGRKPFDADSIPGIALKHLQTEAEPLPNKFKKLEPVFRKLIEKDRATRYSDASEVIADMTAIAKK